MTDPTPEAWSADLGNRYWGKVNADGPIPGCRPDLGPCWIWTAALDPRGYGRYNLGRNIGTRLAHSLSFIALAGPIPEGKELDHLCRVRACVNPRHLEPVTHAENIRRGEWAKGAAIKRRARTHCKWGHEFTEENTYRPPKRPDTRACAQCRRDAKKRATERRGTR